MIAPLREGEHARCGGADGKSVGRSDGERSGGQRAKTQHLARTRTRRCANTRVPDVGQVRTVRGEHETRGGVRELHLFGRCAHRPFARRRSNVTAARRIPARG